MFKVFVPFIGFCLSLFEYLFVPNVRENKNPERYTIFLSSVIVIYAIVLVFSLIALKKGDKRLFEKTSNRSMLIFAIYIFLAVFDLLTLKSGILTYPFIPWFNDIINASIEDYKMLLKSLLYSLRLLFVSYFVGSIAGLATGVLAGFSKRIRYWVEPLLHVLGPIPPATWIPLAMILAHSLFSGSVFIIALGVWYNVALSTIYGVINVKKEYIDSAKILGANNKQIIFNVVLPSSLPEIFNGLSSGMTSACITLIIAEMIGVEAGLGWYIEWAKAWAMYNRMFASIIIICILFNCVNKILKEAKKYFLRWRNEN